MFETCVSTVRSESMRVHEMVGYRARKRVELSPVAVV
jgi:hypothetical protein